MNSLKLTPLLAVALLTGCPEPLKPDPLEPPPRISSFTASETKVAAGAQVTLDWATEGATEVKLEELSLGSVGNHDTSGSLVVTITKNSLFMLTARNSRGAAQRAVVGVSVLEAEGDLLLTATETEIDSGEAVTLAWSAAGASAVTLSTPAGAVDLGGQVESGAVTVMPTATTTYTLAAGTRSASVTVKVRPTVLSFTSSSDALDLTDAGTSVTLSWSTANAERVQLLTPTRGVLHDSADAGMLESGSFTDVIPAPIDASRLFRYELQVSGAGQTVTRAITLPVRGHPAIISLTAPRFARSGQPLTVAWVTSGAQQLSLLQGGVEIYRSPNAATATAGSVDIIAPTSNVTFEAVVTGGLGMARQSVEVEVVGLPSITLSTNPATVARGAPFTLSWSGQSIRSLEFYDAEGKLAHAESDVTDTGTLPFTFRLGTSGTYRVVANNGLGDLISSSLTVNVTNPFTMTPSITSTLRSGQRVSLSWPGGETLLGFPHDDVQLRPGSTGFDDISATGTPIVFPGTTRDDEFATITTTFRAPFYGRIVGDVITVSTNGYLTFGPGNRLNYVDVPLPSTKLMPNTLAPYWEDLFMVTATGQWQVKTVGALQVLIVQWTNIKTNTPATDNTFQVKVWSNGQIDFEYQTITATAGHSGIQGPRGDEGFGLGVPTSGLGVTFFAPKQSPVTVTPKSRAPIGGMIDVGGTLVPVSVSLDVVRPEELHLSEAMMEPAAAVGASGRWFELFNARDTAVDLSGWTFNLPDGGSGALGGTIAPKGVRVYGTSNDRSMNDDAGVDVQLTGFDVSGTLGSFNWGADGTFGSWSWNNPTTGVALVSDYGPYRFSTDTATSLSRPQVCAGSGSYGNQPTRQRGTPGADSHCGFGYRWQNAPFGYYDIASTGTQLVANTTTSTVVNIDLSEAPFPFFGAPKSAVRVSADGYLTFDLASTNNTFSTNFPATSAPNSVIAVFADDLGGRVANSSVKWKRVGQNEDPFAAAPHWIVQWSHWSHIADDDFNFQVKLFDDGVIEFHFATMNNGAVTTPYGTGMSANTWIENAAGTQALVINASSELPGISPFTAYRISPR